MPKINIAARGDLKLCELGIASSQPSCSMRGHMARILAAAVLLANATLALVPARASMRTRLAPVASMPEGLAAWDCDDLLWTQIPPGATRDLERYAAEGKEELGQNRLRTMREVVGFVDAAADAPWEVKAWDAGVIAWEADQEAAAKAAAKAAQMAAGKAKREAAAAAKAAAEAAAA